MRSPIAPFVVAAAAATALASLSFDARANGRFPASNQIIFSPQNPNLIIGRATYAILPSNDNGKTWQYICEDALALPGSYSFEDPEIGVTFNNSIVAGLDNPTAGLDVSPDMGCNWHCIGGPLSSQNVADVVVRPDVAADGSAVAQTSNEVLALTSTAGEASISSQVFASADDGATWSAVGTPLDPSVTFTTIDVSRTNPSKIYLSGTRGYFTGETASLFVSADNGMTWKEHPVTGFNAPIPCSSGAAPDAAPCPGEASIFIAAVDPNDENVVYLRSSGFGGQTDTPGSSNLYVTKDGGQTFTVAKSFALPATMNSDFLVSGELMGFALSPDGSEVFVGTKETGIWKASATDLSFMNVNSKVQVQCLATRQTSAGMELWACGSEINDFVFGKSMDEGATFQTMMATITSMAGPIDCSSTGTTVSSACQTDANASQCTCSAYAQFCAQTEPCNACLGCGQEGCAEGGVDGGDEGGASPSGDAGAAASDAGSTDAGKATSHAGSSSCGCSVVGGGGTAGLFAAWGLAAVAVRRRRTSRDRSR